MGRFLVVLVGIALGGVVLLFAGTIGGYVNLAGIGGMALVLGGIGALYVNMILEGR